MLFLYLFKMMIFQFATLVPPKIWRVSVVWLILTWCLWKPKPTLLQGWDLIQSPLVKNAEIYTHETWNLGKQGQTTFEYENTNMDMFIIQLWQRFSRETLLIFVNTFQVKAGRALLWSPEAMNRELKVKLSQTLQQLQQTKAVACTVGVWGPMVSNIVGRC